MSESSSDASQTSTSEAQDNRIAAAQDSVNLVMSRASGNSVSVTTTDFGTVSKAFDFATALAKNAASQAAASTDAVQKASTSALAAVQQAYTDFSTKIDDAYTTSKAGEQKVLVGAVVAVLGLVAIKSLSK
ncbi:hypothetical protein GWL_18260 [Herbaspirillum sp. GW103]|uniref:hypothetical protein n=1 Tax=Herbaspirillum sp. GW103 TaxID=1175306 RepID=UPI00025E2EC0|nr:hypothetical protein [Herbaspirillum sp. GW103]EIJ47585.1 hypothetical protein GWL_18260 [Herbaspirillum sp. GW103]